MLSDFEGGGWTEMTPKNWTLGGRGWVKNDQRNRTSFMYIPVVCILRLVRIKMNNINVHCDKMESRTLEYFFRFIEKTVKSLRI